MVPFWFVLLLLLLFYIIYVHLLFEGWNIFFVVSTGLFVVVCWFTFSWADLVRFVWFVCGFACWKALSVAILSHSHSTHSSWVSYRSLVWYVLSFLFCQSCAFLRFDASLVLFSHTTMALLLPCLHSHFPRRGISLNAFIHWPWKEKRMFDHLNNKNSVWDSVGWLDSPVVVCHHRWMGDRGRSVRWDARYC